MADLLGRALRPVQVGGRWYVDADARGVYLKIQDISATIFEGGVGVKYFFSNTVGAEFGYDVGAYSVALGRNDSIDFSGKLKYLVQGVRAGLIIAL